MLLTRQLEFVMAKTTAKKASVNDLDLAKGFEIFRAAYEAKQRSRESDPYTGESKLMWIAPSTKIILPNGEKITFEDSIRNKADQVGFDLPMVSITKANGAEVEVIDWMELGFGFKATKFGPVVTFNPDYKRSDFQRPEVKKSTWSW